jgi:hypothetical protein
MNSRKEAGAVHRKKKTIENNKQISQKTFFFRQFFENFKSFEVKA